MGGIVGEVMEKGQHAGKMEKEGYERQIDYPRRPSHPPVIPNVRIDVWKP